MRHVFKTALVLALVVVICPAFAQAQMCGMSFVHVMVFDTEDKPVEKASFELLGKIPDDVFDELAAAYRHEQQRTFEIPSNAFNEISKEKIAKLPANDDCGNPLKQDAGVTKTKEYRSAGSSTANFGVCLSEGHSFGNALIKLSAQGFVDAYYLSRSFYGCSKSAYFRLLRKQ